MHHSKKTGQTWIKLASQNPKGECTNIILRALKMNRSISFAWFEHIEAHMEEHRQIPSRHLESISIFLQAKNTFSRRWGESQNFVDSFQKSHRKGDKAFWWQLWHSLLLNLGHPKTSHNQWSKDHDLSKTNWKTINPKLSSRTGIKIQN